jgi:hypothetical protein
MAIIASGPSPKVRSDRRLSRSIPRPGVPVPIFPANLTAPSSNLRAVTGVIEGINAIEHELPLSGCRLKVLDMPDGSRIGQLFAPSGRWLDEARCEPTGKVSGWFGRESSSGTSWALAFGAGGSQETLEVRFASLRARRVVPVVSDHNGLWVAEVVGSFRAATILAPSQASTFRLHYVS